MSDASVAKRAAAWAAADLVQNGTTIGLGSGSTFLFVIDRLAERMRTQGLRVVGVPTSKATADAAASTRCNASQPPASRMKRAYFICDHVPVRSQSGSGWPSHFSVSHPPATVPYASRCTP